mmetsp:Transcript_34815/g.88218  ORF Transcript_34815/g.88218 Transcript_34815/m.88218 type:complete len:689 (-) Transcript_34815:380-2446(-)|eukprot:CAMPEP_0202864158 /NCGR_PEP_ID=MMETSP1391-20130828/4512_1 /ASSEMBLY_ACC=CAM_ASM_000867 /TAXON_ID=1034604 /ORGANISM="Chlamydomonas leiostraca, Strain SAG 11-49" /LENGTH=688 /DNA_ID=CAMNT_0049543871 /DNA_START=245 /DNA_END=2311 /DNA_ORIENTATION=+
MIAKGPYTTLVVYAQGTQVAVQPKLPASAAQLDTMSVDLASGSVEVLMSPAQSGGGKEVLGIMGLCKLYEGHALVVVTESRHVATLHGSAIFELVKAEVIAAPDARKSRENRELLGLLEDAVDPGRSGRGLYFSYFHDLTLTLQRSAELRAASPDAFTAQVPAQRADPRFLWNRALARPLMAANAHKFVLPCILGFVEQLPKLGFRDTSSGQPVSATLTLIARRSADRAGTRQWRRGADPDGNAANYVETEQVLLVDGPPSSPLLGHHAAYTIVRGSIPLLWTQLPNIKYKPNTVIGPADVSGPAHDRHFQAMSALYKRIVAVNLINHHGTEGKLEAAFRAEATRACDEAAGSPLSQALKYVAFDFHAECGNKRYHRLTFLWDKVKDDFENQAYFLADASGTELKRQTGVMRINCIDCLDRTNVVQGVFARKALEAVLVGKGLLAAGSTLPEAYPDVEAKFKILWADHGDAISTQYAGTGAMKSGFTRTGKRTTMGVLDDGYKAVARYYLNNFQDGVKQDAIDLLTGAYQCDGSPPPLKSQPSPFIPIGLALAGIAVAAHNFGHLLRQGAAAAAPPAVPLQGLHRQLLSAVLLGVGSSSAPGGAFGSDASAAAATASVTRNLTAASVAEAGAGPSAAMAALRFVLVPLLLGLAVLAFVVQNGKHLVNKPRLCPAAAVTVTKPPKKKAA